MPVVNKTFDHVPIDWSLKLKLRVLSEMSLQWCSQVRSSDEAQGVSTFVSEGFSCSDKQVIGHEQFTIQFFYYFGLLAHQFTQESISYI